MITFIVPSYNQGRFIGYSLDSILAIMAPEDQLIIADGASKDETIEVVKTYLSDPRIQFFSEPDRGFSDAVSKALKLATNPIVGIMSSDDAYVMGIRPLIIDSFRDPKVGLIYGDYEVIDINNKRLYSRYHKEGRLESFLSLRVLLPQSSVFFRRVLLEGLTILDSAHDYIADVVLFNQIVVQCKVKWIPRVLSQVRSHSGSRTGKRNPGIQYIEAINTLFSHLSPRDRRLARAGGYLLRARYEASSGNRSQSLKSLGKALKLDPFLPNHWLFYRTLLYLIFGPRAIDQLKRLCFG